MYIVQKPEGIDATFGFRVECYRIDRLVFVVVRTPDAHNRTATWRPRQIILHMFHPPSYVVQSRMCYVRKEKEELGVAYISVPFSTCQRLHSRI